jgi:hypothetical protein
MLPAYKEMQVGEIYINRTQENIKRGGDSMGFKVGDKVEFFQCTGYYFNRPKLGSIGTYKSESLNIGEWGTFDFPRVSDSIDLELCDVRLLNEPKKKTLKQKIFRRKYMNKNIIELFPKTKDAVLVEKYFATQFEDELSVINYKGKTDEILELAKEKQKEEKEANKSD